MSDITGTDNISPATPYAVAPLKSTSSDGDPTGTFNRPPATPLVVPPISVASDEVIAKLPKLPKRAVGKLNLAPLAVMSVLRLRSRKP